MRQLRTAIIPGRNTGNGENQDCRLPRLPRLQIVDCSIVDCLFYQNIKEADTYVRVRTSHWPVRQTRRAKGFAVCSLKSLKFSELSDVTLNFEVTVMKCSRLQNDVVRRCNWLVNCVRFISSCKNKVSAYKLHSHQAVLLQNLNIFPYFYIVFESLSWHSRWSIPFICNVTYVWVFRLQRRFLKILHRVAIYAFR